ncbi:hypothetical protein BURPS1710b_0045 [Burkholderia pseudomallei 1710b]|uniref:Uncharacterized protein n=1 Tax=Burkholderia pseudomallei (strain 1710b) TaxID=320372 RepID=Q3JY91_BURP1|nr:hypothetical protein BURPS1710b_0045 [Burkholderia pseudomallei 1710b]
MVEDAARSVGRMPARFAGARGRARRVRRMGRGAARQARVRRDAGGLRFHVHVLVHDALHRALPVFVVGARHQDARVRDHRPAVPEGDQAALPEALVRRLSAHARRARRCDRARRALLQHARRPARAADGEGVGAARRRSGRISTKCRRRPEKLANIARFNGSRLPFFSPASTIAKCCSRFGGAGDPRYLFAKNPSPVAARRAPLRAGDLRSGRPLQHAVLAPHQGHGAVRRDPALHRAARPREARAPYLRARARPPDPAQRRRRRAVRAGDRDLPRGDRVLQHDGRSRLHPQDRRAGHQGLRHLPARTDLQDSRRLASPHERRAARDQVRHAVAALTRGRVRRRLRLVAPGYVGWAGSCRAASAIAPARARRPGARRAPRHAQRRAALFCIALAPDQDSRPTAAASLDASARDMPRRRAPNCRFNASISKRAAGSWPPCRSRLASGASVMSISSPVLR